VLKAQQSAETAAAPVSPQIATARKIFISNAGIDSTSLPAFKKAGEPDQPYNRFYAAMKSWGRYELVTTPADADLVFEVRFTTPLIGCNELNGFQSQFGLTILDTKTHFRLWTITELVKGANRKPAWDKNFSDAVTNLVDDVRKLVPQPAGSTNSPSK